MAAVAAHAHCTPIKRDSQCRDDNVNEDDGDGDDNDDNDGDDLLDHPTQPTSTKGIASKSAGDGDW